MEENRVGQGVKMKEAIKDSIKLKKLSKEEIIKEIGRQLLFCAFAYLMSRGRVLGGILPFGAAFVAAVPVDYLALSTAVTAQLFS